jgi:hypothetical protein
MIERTLEKKDGYGRVLASAVARVPTRQDVEDLKAGGLAPDCFGRISRVTRIFARREDKDGRLFACYYCAMSERDTTLNGCGCSADMKEGELVRTLALTGLLNSDECDMLERQMVEEHVNATLSLKPAGQSIVEPRSGHLGQPVLKGEQS